MYKKVNNLGSFLDKSANNVYKFIKINQFFF